MTVRRMETDEEIRSTHRVMSQLRPGRDEEEYLEAVRRLEGDGYRLAAAVEDGEVRSVAGYRIGDSLAWGKHVYVDDLVTDGEGRSRGFGQRLLDWLEQEGRRHGCVSLHLDSGTQRHAAHRFYLRQRMDIVFFHFAKSL